MRLRPEPLGQRRGADEVAEEHGDLLALAFERAPGREDLLGEMPRRVRCGLRASGPAGGAGAGAAGPAAPTARPHSEQNFAVSGSSAPQAAQAGGSRWPHSRQNFAREGLSCWQRGHRIEVRPGMLGGGRRYPVVTSWQNWPTRYGSWNVPARPRRTSSAAACDSARR